MLSYWFTPVLAFALADPGQRAGEEFFESKVRPVLVEHCQSCHGAKKQMGGLRLDSADALKQGGDTGPAMVPGDPARSLLVKAVQYDGELKMPPKGKLPPDALSALKDWVAAGAPWPATAAPSVSAKTAVTPPHWAFQPVKSPTPPDVHNAAWVKTPVDRFVLAKLEAAKLAPSDAADRPTLLRRLTFDLHGLPPTVDEIDAFVNDSSPDAVATVVDRLLASPRYGERWGRHWLDVARYADTKGYVFQEERRLPFAYTYRDYVIESFNHDLPYDRFILEQLAADQLNDLANPSHLAALGFLTVGRRFLNNVHDIADDRIDVTSRGFLGLTVSCARCHDHKFDAIPTRDYYAMHGMFTSSVEPKELPLIAKPEQTAAFERFQRQHAKLVAEAEEFFQLQRRKQAAVYQATAALSGGSPFAASAPLGVDYLKATPPEAVQRRLTRADRDQWTRLKRKADAYLADSPDAPPRAMVLNDIPQPRDSRVLLRGNPATPGPIAPRRFLTALTPAETKPITKGSGRLDLAKAIAAPSNPLTARVFVNRVWQHHFGRGLVDTPSDFGVRADPPTHPELLDDLAQRFMDGGWSIKKLHRLILLSNTYAQRSDPRPDAVSVDPENRLLARMNRQRLEWEALRDSLLAASGGLEERVGGPAVDLLKAPYTGRRTVYGHIDRQNLPGLFRTFDIASPDAHVPQRYQTTVPQQALALMNAPFVHAEARRLSDLAEREAPVEIDGRIAWLVKRVLGRSPTSDEEQWAVEFLCEGERRDGAGLSLWARYAQALLLCNEFAFVD